MIATKKALRLMSQLPRVGIIDYQMGNLRSVSKGVERAGGIPIVSDSYADLRDLNHLILPGVGAFRDAIDQLRRRDWVSFITDWVAADRNFLGICLGLQLLLDRSFEGGEFQGLGILKGKVVKFEFGDRSLKVPHMGWNQVDSTMGPNDPMLRGMGPKPYFYFVHSYHAVLENESQGWLTSHYGYEFCAAVRRGNLLATQFHPEKSQANGIGLLRNFLTLSTNQCEAYQATTNAG
jgi:glutamine amidotransferase